MSWVKRNLLFLLGSLATVGLLVVAIVYLLEKNAANNKALEELNNAYAELKRLYSLNPHPGSDKIDNIKNAREQQKELRDFLAKTRDQFAPIRPIPDSAQPTTEEFTAQLRRTIEQLRRDAAQVSVTLPPNYNFTFEAIKPRVTFATNSLGPLSVQLGEVKTICDILFRAKISSLDNLRRVRVCVEDTPETYPADYLDAQFVTNDLAVLAPYAMTIRCFSSELAAVLSGFASSSNAIIVKNIEIEPAVGTTGPETQPLAPWGTPPITPQPGMPMPLTPPVRPPGIEEEAALPPAAAVTAPSTTPAPVTRAVAGRGSLPIVINEKAFRVSLRLDIVKLIPPKTSEASAAQ